jgi:hypothetical protein
MDLDRRMRDAGLSAGRGITDPLQRDLAEARARRRVLGGDEEASRVELERLRRQQEAWVGGGQGEAVKPEVMLAAEQRRADLLRRSLEIRQQEYEAQKLINEEAVAGAQRALQILEQRRNTYAQQAEGFRQEYRSGAEAWGTMDAAQRARALYLKKQFEGGQEMTPELEKELMETPVSAQMRERIRKRWRDRRPGNRRTHLCLGADPARH